MRHCRRNTLFNFLAVSTLVEAAFDQTHLRPSGRAWTTPSDPNASLIFNSVNSLLQQWPDTRYCNGHSVASATIPIGTAMYHGRTDESAPTTLDWLAFDPDHSYLFCFGRCHFLTFVATRELRVAYFDGSSANKLTIGTLDTQDIVTLGGISNARPPWDEMARFAELCEWGKQYNLDGFLRMEPTFEFMVCDFSSGLQLVSSLNIPPAEKLKTDLPEGIPQFEPKAPKGWKGRLRTVPSVSFESFLSGSHHNDVPGETRVKLDYSKIFTFYDPSLTSLVKARKYQTRSEYRAGSSSAADAKVARARIADIFSRPGRGSGIDWGSVTRAVVDRYGDRLRLLKDLLENPGPRNVTEQASQIRNQILIVLTPYMLVDAIPPSETSSRSWVAPIAHHCAMTLTSWAPVDLLTREERVIQQAVEEVLHEICRVVSDIWVDAFGVEELTLAETSQLIQKWTRDVTNLTSWLDWSIWFTCHPVCGPEKICYIPTWPWIKGGLGQHPPDPYGGAPRCISRVPPLPGGLRHLNWFFKTQPPLFH